MGDNFERMFLAVLNGKSVRECEKEYGIDRKTFAKKCKERFPEDSEQMRKLRKVLSHIRSNIQKKDVDEERLGRIVRNLLDGKINTLIDAKALYLKPEEEMDSQTFKAKIVDLVNTSDDDELKREWIDYEARRHPDYAHINFKALIIEMIEHESSQTDIASKYGIPARTVSRELAKLEKDEEYIPVYDIAKELAQRKMLKTKSEISLFKPFERRLIKNTLKNYDEGPVIISNPKTEAEKKYEKAKELKEKAENSNATTLKGRAKAAGVSLSTLKRAYKTVEAFEKMRGKDEQGDEVQE